MALRFDRADVPIPTTAPLAPSTTIRRAKTLTRPDRGVPPPPLIAPQSALLSAAPTPAAAAPAAETAEETPAAEPAAEEAKPVSSNRQSSYDAC